MRRGILIPAVLIIGVCLMIGPGQAQVIREDGVKSIAGILYSTDDTAEWTFTSSGGEILFASLDADIYRESMGGHKTATSADTGGGCSDEGGPFQFYIKVIGPEDNICEAYKPAPPPGWMRDPRMACKLPTTQKPTTYTLQVGLVESGEDQVQFEQVSTEPEYYGFLLNVSLRKIAPTGGNIQSAIAQSGNHGF